MTQTPSDLDSIPAMPKNPLLTDAASDPAFAQPLQRPTSELAQNTRPPFMANEQSPVQWSSSDWQELETKREDLFDMAAVAQQFDYEKFLLDGYAVFTEIMTPRAIEQWMEALQYGQQLNDRLLQADWSQIDWQGLGRTPPPQFLTADEIDKALGGSQAVPQKTDEAGVRTLRQHSLFAEYFPAGHIPFLMNVLTHPQMLQLQRMCLGCEAIYFDHNQLLSRPGGYPGGPWHSHKIGGGKDDCGSASLDQYKAQPNALLTLCYPQGFAADNDGGLKIIRGSHLFRDPSGCRGADDDEMRQGWLQGRLHPVTGEPLQIEHLALPPGSVVHCLSHAAHGVSPKGAHKKTRWCSLLCYKKADDTTGHVQPPSSIPPVWAMKAQRDELPPVLAELLRLSYDKELTGGRAEFDQP
jgi:hypothetical protein